MTRATRTISDEAILRGTGKPFAHWCRVLDRFDVRGNGHKAAARHLKERHIASAWWAQMLTIAYEHERGLRGNLQRHDQSFAVSVQRTLRCRPAAIWDAFREDAVRCWLSPGARLERKLGGRYFNGATEVGEVVKIRPGALLRIAVTADADSSAQLEWAISARDEERATVRVEIQRLASTRSAARQKKAWSAAVDRLKRYLAEGRPA